MSLDDINLLIAPAAAAAAAAAAYTHTNTNTKHPTERPDAREPAACRYLPRGEEAGAIRGLHRQGPPAGRPACGRRAGGGGLQAQGAGPVQQVIRWC